MDIFNNICRICLENKSDIYSIFDSEQSRYLPAIIFNISGVKILKKKEPGSKICSNCKKAVLIAESIIFRCQETEEFLEDQKSFSSLKAEYGNDDNLSTHDTINEMSEVTPTEEHSDKTSEKPSNILKCDKCKFICNTAKNLIQHRSTKHNIDDPNIFGCPKCPERFPRKFILHQHIENVHEILPEEKKFLCNECGKVYTTQKHLSEHRQEAHEPRRFKCVEPNCRQTFTRAFTMRRHFLAVHDAKPRYFCPDCDMHFKIYDLWRYHDKTVHKNQKKVKLNVDEI